MRGGNDTRARERERERNNRACTLVLVTERNLTDSRSASETHAQQIIIALVLLSLGFVIFLIICKGFKCVS